jgi:hypothetical protein
VTVGQLTFEVTPHRDLDDLRIAGSLKLSGDLRVQRDLNHGDELLVTVTDADGSVLARAQATISAPPSFVPIEDKDLGLIGYDRAHRAKLGDSIA